MQIQAIALQVISILFLVSVAGTVFGYGLGAQRNDLLYLLRRPRLLIVSLLAMFVVMPVVALALELYLDLSHAGRVALVITALSPIPQLLPRTGIASGGRAAYSYGLAFGVALVAPLLIPALVHFLGRLMDRPFGVEPHAIAAPLLSTVFFPLLLGIGVQRLWPQLAERIQEPIAHLAAFILNIATGLLFLLVLPAVLNAFDAGALLAISVFVAVGLLVGHVMGGPEPDQAVVLAIACANRNPGIAIAIAAANFPAEHVGAMMVLYAILVGLVSKPYVNWQQQRLRAKEQAEIQQLS